MKIQFKHLNQDTYDNLSGYDTGTFYLTNKNAYLGNLLLSENSNFQSLLAQIENNTEQISKLETVIGSLDNLTTTTKDSIINAINEILQETNEIKIESQISILEDSSLNDYAKSYLIYQGSNQIGNINIPKDMVVSEGYLETNPDGYSEGTYIVLVIANSNESKIYINVADLIEAYEVEKNATQIQLSIINNEISARIVQNAVGENELKDNSITTEKIANNNITNEKLSLELQNSIQLANSAIQNITTGDFGGTILVDNQEVPIKDLGYTNSGSTSIPVYLKNGTLTPCDELSLNTNGNAATATALKQDINLTLDGSLSGSTSSNGSQDINISTALNWVDIASALANNNFVEDTLENYEDINPDPNTFYKLSGNNGLTYVYLGDTLLSNDEPPKKFAKYTPEEIQQIVQEGNAANLWAVGDSIPITLDGDVSTYTFEDETYYAFIIGFDHNASLETNGQPSITLQFGKSENNVDICFRDPNYDGGSSSSATGFRMNTSNTNSGGWNSSRMKNTICPAFLAALPEDWQTVVSTITKYTDNTGGGSNTASYVTATDDEQIFLLAEYEIFGARSYANSAEQNYQQQYDYYAAGNSTIKYKHFDPSSAAGWWGRSARSSTSSYFCAVYSSGSAGNNNAYYSNGFAPAFVIS